VALTIGSFLLLYPASAHAQGGVPLWTNRYEVGGGAGPSGMAVDNAGNVFVTGFSSDSLGNEDYATIKYSNAGHPLWTNRYDRPANEDRAAAIAVDGSGNVFVTGYSASGDGADYATIKYSGAGVPLWTNRYNGPGNRDDQAKAVAVDGSGNVFVTGHSSGSGSSYDYATIAYSSAGVSLWTNRYDAANGLDLPYAIAVDARGNVFVTGESLADSSDFATAAYSNTGVPLWTTRYDGPANLVDGAAAIAVDTSGNVFVTGRSFANLNPFNSDYATVAYSNSAEPLWSDRYARSSTSYEYPIAIAVDSSGNVFVTGYSEPYWATVAYSSTGVKLWTRLYNTLPGGGVPAAIAVDRSGNVFVTGSADSRGTTIAYSNSGVPLWTNRVGNAFSKLAVDRSGNVFVTGSSYDGTNSAYVTIKYSSSIPPVHLDFQKLNNELVLSWTNAGFTLQSAPFVTGPFTNLPAATSPYTNPLTAPQQFFRLISN
jgi:hypothetical protein